MGWHDFVVERLGSGMDGTVYALALEADGNLYAGGDFTTAGEAPANHDRQVGWRDSSWSALGTGMDSSAI